MLACIKLWVFIPVLHKPAWQTGPAVPAPGGCRQDQKFKAILGCVWSLDSVPEPSNKVKLNKKNNKLKS